MSNENMRWWFTIIIVVALDVARIGTTTLDAAGPNTALTAERAQLYVAFRDQIDLLDYGEPMTTRYLFIEGEPLSLEIGILSMRRDRDVAAEAEWPALITLTARPGRLRDEATASPISAVCRAGVTQSSPQTRFSGRFVILGPGDRQFFPCEIDVAATHFTSGAYTLTIGWLPSVDMVTLQPPKLLQQRRPVLGDSTDFELRSVQSSADRSDLLTRLAYRALLVNRDLAHAAQFAASALETNPLNADALAAAG